MGACRENMNIWRMIKNCFFRFSKGYDGRPYEIKRLYRLLSRDVWKYKSHREYLFHDSFGRYFNRLIGCRVFGHRKAQWMQDGGCSDERPKWYCFNCDREVDLGIDKIINRKG